MRKEDVLSLWKQEQNEMESIVIKKDKVLLERIVHVPLCTVYFKKTEFCRNIYINELKLLLFKKEWILQFDCTRVWLLKLYMRAAFSLGSMLSSIYSLYSVQYLYKCEKNVPGEANHDM